MQPTHIDCKAKFASDAGCQRRPTGCHDVSASIEPAAIRHTTIDACDRAFDALQILHLAGFPDTHAQLE